MICMKPSWVRRTALVLLMGLAAAGARAQEPRPPEVEAQLHRAETAWKSGASLLEAKARVDQVLEDRPDDAGARKLRARVLLSMQRPADALTDARRAVQLAPDDADAHLVMCEAARLAGRLDVATQALDAAAGHGLEDAGFHVRLSWNAAELEQLDKAAAFARVALALDPRLPEAYYQLARVFVLQGQRDDAVLILERGFRRSVIDPGLVRRDPVLRVFDGDPRLRTFLN